MHESGHIPKLYFINFVRGHSGLSLCAIKRRIISARFMAHVELRFQRLICFLSGCLSLKAFFSLQMVGYFVSSLQFEFKVFFINV